MTQAQRQLGIFRNMLIYAGIRNTPKPLPFPHLEPIDEFWQMRLTQHLSGLNGKLVKDRILQSTQKIAEEIAWDFDSEIAQLTLNVSDRTSFEQLYGDWFITVMHPTPVEV
jgi:hypothetical protein